MFSPLFAPKELSGAYVIILKNNKPAKISNVSPDLSKIYVTLNNVPLSYSLPEDLDTKIKFADAELQERVKEALDTKSAPTPKAITPAKEWLAPNDLPPRPRVQPRWVEDKGLEFSASLLKDKKLKHGHFYGSDGHDIYLRGCQALGWDYKKESHFMKRTTMYATDATPEGYSVWFLVHHSWIENPEKCTERWWNTVGSDIVHEDWICNRLKDEDLQNFKYDHTKRLTFAKGKNGQYYYIGIFEPIGLIENQLNHKCNGGSFHTKVYKRIG